MHMFKFLSIAIFICSVFVNENETLVNINDSKLLVILKFNENEKCLVECDGRKTEV